MLWRVDFIQGKTNAADYGQVVHSLVDTAVERVIMDLKLSGDRLQAVSNYSREPKRLEFECFIDGWIEDYLLSGDYEHERYISHYEVKVYRDAVLIFSGIIDCSLLSHDPSGIIKVTCYDKLKLLQVYSDLTHYYSLTSGYLPQWILGYFAQDISQAIPVSVPYVNALTLPAQTIALVDARTLAHVDYDDLVAFPNPTGGWTYSFEAGYSTLAFGYRYSSLDGRLSFVFGMKRVVKAVYPDPAATRYQGRFRGRVYRVLNGLCLVASEYDVMTDWADSLDAIDAAVVEYESWFTAQGVPVSTFGSLTGAESRDGKGYGSSHAANLWVEANVWGNIFPTQLHPGKSYVTHQTEKTSNMQVLQAMMMLYNATLVADVQGRIVMRSKDTVSGATVVIADNDVVSIQTKRGNQEQPDMSVLDVFAGDTALLKQLVKDYLLGWHGGKWSIEAVIDGLDKYAIVLQGRIQIRGVDYVVYQVEKDFVNDDYKISAWRID